MSNSSRSSNVGGGRRKRPSGAPSGPIVETISSMFANNSEFGRESSFMGDSVRGSVLTVTGEESTGAGVGAGTVDPASTLARASGLSDIDVSVHDSFSLSRSSLVEMPAMSMSGVGNTGASRSNRFREFDDDGVESIESSSDLGWSKFEEDV